MSHFKGLEISNKISLLFSMRSAMKQFAIDYDIKSINDIEERVSFDEVFLYWIRFCMNKNYKWGRVVSASFFDKKSANEHKRKLILYLVKEVKKREDSKNLLQR